MTWKKKKSQNILLKSQKMKSRVESLYYTSWINIYLRNPLCQFRSGFVIIRFFSWKKIMELQNSVTLHWVVVLEGISSVSLGITTVKQEGVDENVVTDGCCMTSKLYIRGKATTDTTHELFRMFQLYLQRPISITSPKCSKCWKRVNLDRSLVFKEADINIHKIDWSIATHQTLIFQSVGKKTPSINHFQTFTRKNILGSQITAARTEMNTELKGEGFIVLTQVSFVGRGGRLYKEGEAVPGTTTVISKFLRTRYLCDNVRVIEGAYWGFCTFDANDGLFTYLRFTETLTWPTP